MAILGLVTVGLLVSGASAAYSYTYAKSDCTGDPVAGLTAPTDVCIGASGFKLTCNSTHLSAVDCEAGLPIFTFAVGECLAYQKFTCSGSITNPADNTAVFQYAYDNDDCSGSSGVFQWAKLDVCIPDTDSAGRSSKMSKNTTTGMIDTWAFASSDCAGDPVGMRSQLAEMSQSNSYSASAMTSSSKVTVYVYADQNCTGNPVTGSAYNAANDCTTETSSYTCTDNMVHVWSYDGGCPSGTKTETGNYTTNTCLSGTKYMCNSDMNIPAMSYVESTYHTSSCSSPDYTSFFLTGACLYGNKYTYDSTKKVVTRTTYDDDLCQGNVVGDPDVFMISSTASSLSMKSAAASAFPSIFVFAFVMIMGVIVKSF